MLQLREELLGLGKPDNLIVGQVQPRQCQQLVDLEPTVQLGTTHYEGVRQLHLQGPAHDK